mgnify:CR=1 FL=1
MLFTRPAIGNILRTVIYEALFIGCSVTFKDPASCPGMYSMPSCSG